MDKNKVFVGNLPWSFNNDTLKELFSKYGEVVEAVVIMDRASGRSKGFGFVTFVTEESMKKAIDKGNGQEIERRKLVVNAAKPREERGARGGFRDNRGRRDSKY